MNKFIQGTIYGYYEYGSEDLSVLGTKEGCWWLHGHLEPADRPISEHRLAITYKVYTDVFCE